MISLHTIKPPISQTMIDAAMGVMNSHAGIRIRFAGDRVQYRWDSYAAWQNLPDIEMYARRGRELRPDRRERFAALVAEMTA